MAEQSLLIRIGIDPSGAVTGGKVVESSLGGIDNRLKGMTQRFGEGARVGEGMERMFGRLGSMPRIQVFNFLAQDILYASGGMGKLSEASGLLRTGLFAVQGTASALLGPAGFGVLAVAGLAVVTMFTKKAQATKLAKEELEKNKMAVQDNISSLIELAKVGDRYARVLIVERIAELEEQSAALEGSIRGAAQRLDELAKTNIYTADASKTITDRLADQRIQILKLKEALESITEKAKADEFNKALQRILNPPIKPSIQLGFEGGKKAADDLAKSVMKGSVAIDYMNEYLKKQEPIWDKQKQKAEQWRSYVASAVSNISGAFGDMMMGIEVNWGKMIQTMMAQIAELIAQAAIMGALFPNIGFMGFLGFQKGTPFVPMTGLYVLHQGEAVIPANQSVYQSSVFNQQRYGDTYNIQIIQLDPKKLTKEKIAPILKEMVKNRELSL